MFHGKKIRTSVGGADILPVNHEVVILHSIVREETRILPHDAPSHNECSHPRAETLQCPLTSALAVKRFLFVNVNNYIPPHVNNAIFSND